MAPTLKDSSGNDLTDDFTVSGTSIRGNSDTVYSGLNFTFSGTGTLGTITVTEGIASQVYSTASDFGSTTTGSIQNIITSLQDDDVTLASRYTFLMTQAQNYTTFLTDQYATLSAKIAASNQTLVTLKALIDAGNNS